MSFEKALHHVLLQTSVGGRNSASQRQPRWLCVPTCDVVTPDRRYDLMEVHEEP